MPTFLNPGTIHAPVGAYTHTVTVPPGSELVFISGQVAVRLDGSIPDSFAEQAEVVFANLRACLEANGVGMDALVKITTFMVPGHDIQSMREVRQRHFGEHRPASTAIYVPQLANPAFLIEVEAVAVRTVP